LRRSGDELGSRAYSMQFHLGVEADTAVDLAATLARKMALHTALGEKGITTLKTRCDEKMVFFNTMAERVYIN